MDKYIEFETDSNRTSCHSHRKKQERQIHTIECEDWPDKKIV